MYLQQHSSISFLNFCTEAPPEKSLAHTNESRRKKNALAVLNLLATSLTYVHLSRMYLECRMKIESDFESENSIRCIPSASHTSNSKWKVPKKYALTRNNNLCRYLLRHTQLSQVNSVRWYKPKVVSAMSSSDTDQPNAEDEQPVDMAKTFTLNIEYSRINFLTRVIHESANSFSSAIQTLEAARHYPELAMAWIGVDVQSWHKKLSYKVAVYALFKSAIEVELFLSQKRHTNASASKILYPTISSLGKCIEDLLKSRNPNLVNWFKMVELPRIAELFIHLFKKWSRDYAGSGVAGIILAISCCIAVRKLGSGRLSDHSLYVSIENILVQLMNLSYTSPVSMGKLHHLASEAGFEEEFLLHFGTKILPSKSIEDIEFWIGLVQKKLSVAFHRESVISGKQEYCDKDQEYDLAILGLFAFLGKKTRLFLSRMKIKDLDEQVEDFLNYLECGSLFIDPKFSSLPKYQLFMEVITDEIEWLDFYAEYNCKFYQDIRRSKKRTIRAKQEIILIKVFTTCYDVFSGLAHYFSTSQRPLDSKLLVFLHRSQSLLSICMEDYWAAYDRSGELVKKTEGDDKKFTTSSMEVVSKRRSRFAKSTSIYASLLSKVTSKFTDLWMGTQLFCFDVLVSINLVLKQLWGKKVTERERKKIARTLADLATLAPVTILMLIPMSAVAHAVTLIAVRRCIPALIPSQYSSERFNMVKQFKRRKEMEIDACSNIEDDAF
ncbi:LETM1 domain-containing protein [Heracleum sosnowskyi]|uniref:LETM1 domain-containing protein n=1 Tax=Heracleum sosnowskyi TaxID=360622 RepID=A0AAD8HB31_9APIA|nr:LETM1 domain-containing protein [Heracleum sosnowskyi]